MTVQRDVGVQFALVKEILDPTAQKRQVEEEIRAPEQRNKRFLGNAARLDMHATWNQSLKRRLDSQPVPPSFC